MHYIRVSPYYVSSYGLEERAVRTFKQGFRRDWLGTLPDGTAMLIFNYRNTPHTAIGMTSAELLMEWKL